MDNGAFPKSDAGTGKLNDYRYDLVPKNRRVTMVLAGSDPAQEELERLATSTELQAFISKRTTEEERTDAPVAVRFFVDSRMTGIVGYVPRGLESPVFEALTRLERDGKTRIPANITKTRKGLRVALLMGLTR
jgi:hypothetical protein